MLTKNKYPEQGGTETSQSLQQKFPVTEVFSHIEVADGRIWLKQPGGIGCFAGDLPETEQKLVWATQAAPVTDLFNQKVDGVAWRFKPKRKSRALNCYVAQQH